MLFSTNSVAIHASVRLMACSLSTREEAWVPPQVSGVHTFQGQRLHVLQVGLGTFNAFLRNICDKDEEYPLLTWLLQAVGDQSKNLRGVGVEPVSEHIANLQSSLQQLPNSTLVQAAMSKSKRTVDVYGITPEAYQGYLDEAHPSDLQRFTEHLMFMRNMSCWPGPP